MHNHKDEQVEAFLIAISRDNDGFADVQEIGNGEFIIDGVVNVRAALDAVMSKAERDIIAERRRQVDAEGWSPEHDDAHSNGELAAAAGCYALHAHDDLSRLRHPDGPAWWPFSAKWWKPKTPRENLVKAAALAVAEIERIDRAATYTHHEPGEFGEGATVRAVRSATAAKDADHG